MPREGALRCSGCASSSDAGLDVDVPTPAGGGGELPRFGLPFSGIGKPQIVIAAEDGQFTAFEFGGPLEIGERHKVQALFERPVSRCFWEARIGGVNEFPAGRVNRRSGCRELWLQLSAYDGRLTVNLAAVIPDEINRSRLTSQSAANRTLASLTRYR
jgi:hypothetical protein